MRCRNFRQPLFIRPCHNGPNDGNPTSAPHDCRDSGQYAFRLIAKHRGMQIHQHHERTRIRPFVVGAVGRPGRTVVREAENCTGMDDPGRRLVFIPNFKTRNGSIGRLLHHLNAEQP